MSTATQTAAIPRRAVGTWEVAVIGSGFGGAVVAARLAQRGLRVAVLERGRHWGREDFPRPGADGSRWWWREEVDWRTRRHRPRSTGLYEIVRGRRMSLLVASGVGGGSLIYTNVQMRAPEAAFAGSWPAGFSRAALDPYYDRVFEMLTPSPLPGPLTKTARLAEAAERAGLGARFTRPDLAIYWGEQGERSVNRFGAEQQACLRCGLCAVGCHVHAKNTLDLNYLRLAEQHGARIFPLHRVEAIESVARGYLVHFYRYATSPPERDSIAVARVVLAAGTLGSARILLRSRDVHHHLTNLSPRLGHGFSDNGDFFGALVAAGDVQPAYGPTVTARVDLLDRGLLILDGGIPDFLAGPLNRRLAPLTWLWRLTARLRGRRAPAAAGRAVDSLLPLFLMGLDAGDGRLALDKRGELAVLWKHAASASLFARMGEAIDELARALGAWGISNPAWRFRRHLWGVHPLGGCALAEGPERGVVSEAGEVFGHPGLYIADGSIVPGPLGVPPSMTIAALAERVAEQIK